MPTVATPVLVTPAQPVVDGSRLRGMYLVHSAGQRVLLGMYDTQTRRLCDFWRTGPDSWVCHPPPDRLTNLEDLARLDETCDGPTFTTQEFGRVGSFHLDPDTCHPTYDFWESVGSAARTEHTSWSAETCTETPGEETWHELRRNNGGVTASERIVVFDGVPVRVLTGSDGSQLLQHAVNPETGQQCDATTWEGDAICGTQHSNIRHSTGSGLFTDAQCSEPLIEVVSDCGPREISIQSRPFEVRELGERYQGPLFRRSGAHCSNETRAYETYRYGPVIEDHGSPSILVRQHGEGVVQRWIIGDSGEPVVREEGLWMNRELLTTEGSCDVAMVDEATIVCVPPEIPFGRPFYNDDTCSVPVMIGDFGLAAVIRPDQGAGGVQFPLISIVSAGLPTEGPIYVHDGACEELPNTPLTFRRVLPYPGTVNWQTFPVEGTSP